MTYPRRRGSRFPADSPVAGKRYSRSRLVSAALAGALLWATDTALAVTCVHNIPPSNPNTAYLVHSDGTVTDVRSHLMWKRCPEGRTGIDCAGSLPSQMAVANALTAAAASTFAGHNDWRVPSIQELRSLVEYCASDLTINADVFPNTSYIVLSSPSATFWASSYYSVNLSQKAWTVDFLAGFVGYYALDNKYYVRLVRDDFDSIFASGFDL